MRRLPALLSTTALIVLLAACTSGAGPGWTYAPAPSATPVASGGASGEPGASASAPAASASAPAASASAPAASGSPAASGGSGSTVTIKAPMGAATAGFDPTTATAAANAAFQLVFDNEDNQAPHNLILQNPDGSNVAVQGDTAFFTGPGQREYSVPALAAGQYKYLCQVHPTTMLGTLTIQ
jgi:plastocyanin